MGAGTVRAVDLDHLVAECDRLGGLSSPEAKGYLSDFQLVLETDVDQSLDPFSEDYFYQQMHVYREIAGRELNQAEGELTPVDVSIHAPACNPYNTTDIRFIARHARAIHTCLLVANLPPGASVLDMGCGWGLSSEMMAFAGAQVTAVDINPLFVDLVHQRASRLGLPIQVIQAEFDSYQDNRHYDLILFYESLHHSLRPWVTLERVGRLLKPGGKIVRAGEPVNRHWWVYWGLRLDYESVYCMRKFGWWESGWTIEFLSQCFARAGFTMSVIPGVGLDAGPVGFATRAEEADRIQPDRSVAAAQIESLPLRLQVEDLQRLVQNLQGQVQQLHRHIADMQSSRSWRWSAPIRALGRLARRLRGNANSVNSLPTAFPNH